VDIRRVAKTVAGGRRFTFNALVVVGDGQGRVGFGLGKASEVPDAVQKGSAIARRAMVAVPVQESTVPQEIVSRFRGAQVLLKPAAPGTGVRASAAVRAVVQAAGVRDILTKSQGSNNPINVVQATIKGMQMMRNPQQLIALRRTVRGEPPLAPQEQQQQPQPQAEAPRATATPVDASQPGEDTGVVTATPASEESATASEAASADETATASEEQTS
jgi:small subunit ribosomal protein S5